MKINISTCPNDTFMFDALVNGRIDTMGYEFDLHMADIAELNDMASAGEADISKLSYAAYPAIEHEYQILRSGSAIGYGNGPLLVSKRKIYPDEVKDLTIAVAGLTTTSNMLLTIGFGDIKERKEYLFSDISHAVESGEVDAGVLIHEERFLYAEKGLRLVADLGEMWEKKSSLMIPLGAIVIRRGFKGGVKKDIDMLVRNSVRYAFENPDASYDFVFDNARELDEDVVHKHIKMFVNKYSVDLGEYGMASVDGFFKAAGVTLTEPIFIQQ